MFQRVYSTSSLRLAVLLTAICPSLSNHSVAAKPASFESIGAQYNSTVLPILESHCLKCHNEDEAKGDLDLERMESLTVVRREPRVWQKVLFMLENAEMPPKKSKQLTKEQSDALTSWVVTYLDAEAHASAGDPGRVVMRRLTNTEFDHTIRDLTGIDLRPTREFPADSAAGEGFTNTGESMVMSPALLDKYLDAAQEIASHIVLLPDGLRFSQATARRDWADEPLDEIRALYTRKTEVLQLEDRNRRVEDGGILNGRRVRWGHAPLTPYVKALIQHRQRLKPDEAQMDAVAAEAGINPYYLRHLSRLLGDEPLSPLLGDIRQRLGAASSLSDAKKISEAATSIADYIDAWQDQLWRFKIIGHMSERGQDPIDPVTSSHEFRLKFAPEKGANTVTFSLVAHDGADGHVHDHVAWKNARLVGTEPGIPPIRLRDVRPFVKRFRAFRKQTLSRTKDYLEAIGETSRKKELPTIDDFATKYGLDEEMVTAWLGFLYMSLHIGMSDPVKVEGVFTHKRVGLAGQKFVNGWGADLPSLVVNSSTEETAKVPGTIPPRTLSVHPAPDHSVAAGWQSPISGRVRIEASLLDAHVDCGDGVTYSLSHRRGTHEAILSAGSIDRGGSIEIPTIEEFPVQKGDLIALTIGMRDGIACDQTNLELTMTESAGESRKWDLVEDVADDIHAGNPHADRRGNENVWYFYTEDLRKIGPTEALLPAGSVLARWRTAVSAGNAEEAERLAQEAHILLTRGPVDATTEPDRQLYRNSYSMTSGLFKRFDSTTLQNTDPVSETEPESDPEAITYGLEPASFEGEGDETILKTGAPLSIEITLPVELVEKREFVVTGALASNAGDGCVQLEVVAGERAASSELRPSLRVIVREGGDASHRMQDAFNDFRELFPHAMCCRTIVPMDEIVTLVMYHREDQHLSRLILSDAERTRLDRLWQEVRYISHDALKIHDSFHLFMEFASQVGQEPRFEPLRKVIEKNANDFSKHLVETEPAHLDALIDCAEKAFRRPLTEPEEWKLRAVYAHLRAEEEAHEDAIRGVLVRILISPSFLYRIEEPAPGEASGAVTEWELASRLSYFLWSTMPDEKLISSAANASLLEPDKLVEEAHRMLKDDRVRGLATEFACQWLHVRGFDAFDEKNERQYPSFAELRDDMYEETIRFFEDLFERDGSVLEILDADHTFVNGALAEHYDIEGISGDEWQRVDNMKQKSRGGVLGMATVLSKQSGATRTSPVLRGNWIVETLLGEKLPDPPATVPELPDALSREGLTVRQMTERHVSDESCANCHVRIDPFGFALESFDAMGRFRVNDLIGKPVNTEAQLRDGTRFTGIDGLRTYLLEKRRDDFVEQFCRKLLGFALGRSVELSDQPLIEEMVEQLVEKDFRLSAAIETIILSEQFRSHRGLEATHEESM
jgi:hypothetical protein